MEKRIGAAIILIEDHQSVERINQVISAHARIILGRQGLPLREKGVRVISLILEGTTDQISSLTGKLGRLSGVQVKSVLTKYR
ncbi:MAG: iron-only hydrogenase system regulator [Bacteroidales bacterium]|jgi:putative iron-only hydrogenase system regulator